MNAEVVVFAIEVSADCETVILVLRIEDCACFVGCVVVSVCKTYAAAVFIDRSDVRALDCGFDSVVRHSRIRSVRCERRAVDRFDCKTESVHTVLIAVNFARCACGRNDHDLSGIHRYHDGFDDHCVLKFATAVYEFCAVNCDGISACAEPSAVFNAAYACAPRDRREICACALHFKLRRVKYERREIVPLMTEHKFEFRAGFCLDDNDVLCRDIDEIFSASDNDLDITVVESAVDCHFVSDDFFIAFHRRFSAGGYEFEETAVCKDRIHLACNHNIFCCEFVGRSDCSQNGVGKIRAGREYAVLTAYIEFDRTFFDREITVFGLNTD